MTVLAVSQSAVAATLCPAPLRIVASRPVAQSCTLLYRRVALGRMWNCLCAQQHSGTPRFALRRLQICDTAECNSALRSFAPTHDHFTPGQIEDHYQDEKRDQGEEI